MFAEFVLVFVNIGVLYLFTKAVVMFGVWNMLADFVFVFIHVCICMFKI